MTIRVIPLVSISWDCETGFSDSSDLDISVKDREKIETVEEFITKL